MTEEKVENTETTTEETSVSVDSAKTGADVDVSTEKTVEESSRESSGDSDVASARPAESNVNVKVENNIPAQQTQPNPHKNYEAAQPIVDAV